MQISAIHLQTMVRISSLKWAQRINCAASLLAKKLAFVMMGFRGLALLLFCLSPSLALAKVSTFQDAFQRHITAIDQRDWDTFESTLTSSDVLTFVRPNGRFTKGKAEFKAQMRDWFADKDWSWSHELISAHSNDSVGVAVLRITYSDKNEQGRPYSMTYILSLVFSREAGGWKLAHDQNTMSP